ncbi:MAG: hypothetical protein ABIP06_08795 [Pyrinomonadaceae bacterium]
MIETQKFLSIKEASLWASKYIGKDVTPSNITYLINYGRIPKRSESGSILVAKQDLVDYSPARDDGKIRLSFLRNFENCSRFSPR